MALEMRQVLPTALPDARRGPAPAATADMGGIAASDLEDGSEFQAWRPLLVRLGGAGPATQDVGDLVDRAAMLWMRPGFDTFISLPRLRFTPFPYQLRAAETALRRMRGRVLLADEVGLGKTIEAGLVLSELRLRGLARRTLVLAPPGLVGQWQEELTQKFGMPAVLAGDPRRGAGKDRAETPILVASLAAARRGALRAELVAHPWDLVIVDEAHRVRRATSASGRLVRELRTRYLVLLTATPVENRLDDLHQLVTLVRPGLLGTAREFRDRHAATAGGGVRDVAGLRDRVREVMVRHRRSQVAAMLPPRLAETVAVAPEHDEAALYDEVSARVRQEGRQADSGRLLALTAVQRLAGSSPAALAPTLTRMGWHDLAGRAAAVTATAKARTALALLTRLCGGGERVILFTAFRETLALLERLTAEAGLSAVAYHGGLRRQEKDEVIRRFHADVPILLSTEAAGEGRNLQVSRVMVNFDLPWNPMQIEQRVGRIHRIGQHREVLITNLVTRGTIEERILRVLESKLNLFELVVGELDMILGRVADDLDVESFVFRAHLESRTDEELEGRLREFAEDLVRARSGYLDARGRSDVLVPEDGTA
jgi:SNF2 family DNA or RNA helicase